MSKACPICKSKSLKLISDKVWDTKKRKVMQCNKCEITFLEPMLIGGALEKFYANYNDYEKLRVPKKERLAKEKIEQKVAVEKYKFLSKYLRATHTVCEIGASNGYLIDFVNSKVKKAVAIEPSPKENARLKKIVETYSWIEDLPKELKFDMVFMFHTFEHLPNPIAYLNILKKHLKPNAKIIIEVPNINDILLSGYKIEEFKKFYFQSMHPFCYREDTLTNVFGKSGFTLLKCFYIQRYSLANHLSWLLDKKSGGNLNYENKFKSSDNNYRDILKSRKVTDTILSIFQIN